MRGAAGFLQFGIIRTLAPPLAREVLKYHRAPHAGHSIADVKPAAAGVGSPFSPGFFAGRRGKPLIVNGFATFHREIIA
jgi:hypothetical protein